MSHITTTQKRVSQMALGQTLLKDYRTIGPYAFDYCNIVGWIYL
jgi:hypothetical protein